MNSHNNPFSPGAGSRPPELAGRQTIIDDAETALVRILKGRASQAPMLLGLRGTGKTVLLNEIEVMAEKHGYLTSLKEAPDKKKLAEIIYPLAIQVLRRFSAIENARRHVNEAMGALRNFASVFNISVGSVDISVDPVPGIADSGELEFDLTELFVRMGYAAQAANKGWALLIDEVQYLSSDDLGALITALHRINQRALPIFFAGAGLPQIARLAGDAKSYAERLFVYPHIGPLDNEAAKAAIATPLMAEDVAIESDAIESIVERTGGYPFFLQEWGYQVWNRAESSPIMKTVVDEATPEAIKRLDNGFFKVRLDRLTPAEVEYVYAMSKLGSGPYKSNEVAKQMDKDPQRLGPRRASIISKGMIYSPSHGDIDFTVPLFDEFLRRSVENT